MIGSQKHSHSSQSHLDNLSVVSQASLVAKWSGGSTASNTASFGSTNSTLSSGYASHSARQLRSRNIDIPNCKPRSRTKHSTSSTSHISQSSLAVTGLHSRKSALPTLTSNTTRSVAALGAGNLNWHTRPPRGGLAAPVPQSTHSSTADESKWRRGRKTSRASQRDEYCFGVPSLHDSSGWHDDFERDDEHSEYGGLRVVELAVMDINTSKRDAKRHDPPSPVLRPMRNKDAVEDLARALLTDCINKRNLGNEKLRKYNIDIAGTPPSYFLPSGSYPSPKENMKGHTSYEEGSGGLSCSSRYF